MYSYVFRGLADILAVLIRAFHPHDRRTVSPLAGLEKFQGAKLMKTMKAKFSAHFPQKVHVFTHTQKCFCHIYIYTHTFSKPHYEMELEMNGPKHIPKYLMIQ